MLLLDYDAFNSQGRHEEWIQQLKLYPRDKLPAHPLFGVLPNLSEPAVLLEGGGEGHPAAAPQIWHANWTASPELTVEHGAAVAFAESPISGLLPFQRDFTRCLEELMENLNAFAKGSAGHLDGQHRPPLLISFQPEPKNPEPHERTTLSEVQNQTHVEPNQVSGSS